MSAQWQQPEAGCICLTADHWLDVLQGMSYWVRLPTSGPLGSDSSPNLMHESADESSQQELSLTRPIVFLHGVGLGLVRPLTFGLRPALGGDHMLCCVDCHQSHDSRLCFACVMLHNSAIL